MRYVISLVVAALFLTTLTTGFVGTASAEEVKMVGTISAIELATDGKSAVATLKDTKSGEPVSIIITDEETLDKFKDKRIVEGDEIRTKYDKQGGKNVSKMFKKSAGC